MTTFDDEVAAALRQRLDDLPDCRPGEELTSYVAFVETAWTDDAGQRRCDVRRIMASNLNPHQAVGIAVVAAKRLERDLDARHYPTVPAVVPLQSRTSRAG